MTTSSIAPNVQKLSDVEINCQDTLTVFTLKLSSPRETLAPARRPFEAFNKLRRYDEVWNLPYIPVHGVDKIIYSTMTTYTTPPQLVSKKLCNS